ncbi:phBC6A51 family helix-turn-helix protein [Paenibacillus sp. SC116]|uniref:phBC6A51 family helix-turn-helix protein n=1 Tax=Paenibacillus sp. SC116 TaxID=2968986 RepID=UPI00215A995B|nr:phBC6A51 family helix-turn-helix protein [Paenibacillus sp. SC116]MCR8843093.1 phBC6A51 family helix-turn-helix protein [Paenibacillus sp. SC116]
MALKQLGTEHITAIQWLAQPKKGGKTYEEIAELCGVHFNTIANWRKDPLFESELKRQMVRNSQDKLPELIESLSEIAIRDGNAAMAKLALQINGMLTDNVVVETKTSDATDTAALKAKLKELKEAKSQS